MFDIPKMSQCRCNEGVYTKRGRREQRSSIHSKCHTLGRLGDVVRSHLSVCGPVSSSVSYTGLRRSAQSDCDSRISLIPSEAGQCSEALTVALFKCYSTSSRGQTLLLLSSGTCCTDEQAHTHSCLSTNAWRKYLRYEKEPHHPS